MDDGLFSRETLAGYDRERMDAGVVTVVGAGAGGCNAIQTLALAGVGELRLVDFDEVEVSNLTRAPLFDRRRLGGKKKRLKAREAAMGALVCSYAPDPVLRSAVARIEEVGLGGLAGSGVVIAAVDSLRVRALLADATRLLGVPMVEMGFSGSHGQVSVFQNGSDEESCWRCLHPTAEDGPASCTLYAARVAGEGRVPATQPLAAVFGALAAEHAIQALHGRFPLGGRMLSFDLHTGSTRLLQVTADPCCPGVHRRFSDVRAINLTCDAPILDVVTAAKAFAADPVLHLPAPFVVELPCAHCGTPVSVGKPVWAVREPPRCDKCPELPQLGQAGPVLVTTVEAGERLGQRRCRSLGLPPAAIFEIEDRATGTLHPVRLAGGLDDLFEARRRERNAKPVVAMDPIETSITVTPEAAT